MSFLKAQVSFPSTFVSIFSTSKRNSSVIFQLKHYILYFGPKVIFEKFECKCLRHLIAWVKIRQIVLSILKRRVNSSSNFSSFFIDTIHNSSVNFRFMYFLLWIKVSHQSLNSETFECSSKNLPNSSLNFPNCKSVFFFQILHHSSVS